MTRLLPILYCLLVAPTQDSEERSVDVDIEIASVYGLSQVFQHLETWLTENTLPEPLAASGIVLDERSTRRIHIFVNLNPEQGYVVQLTPYENEDVVAEIESETIACHCKIDELVPKIAELAVPMAEALNQQTDVPENTTLVPKSTVETVSMGSKGPEILDENRNNDNPTKPSQGKNLLIAGGVVASLGVATVIAGGVTLSHQRVVSQERQFTDENWDVVDIDRVSGVYRNTGLGLVVGGLGAVAAGAALLGVGGYRLQKHRVNVSLRPALQGISIEGRF